MDDQTFRRPLVGLLIASLLFGGGGCSASTLIALPPEHVLVGAELAIASVVLKRGEVVDFADGALRAARTKEGRSYNVIVGRTGSGMVEIETTDIYEIRYVQTTSGGAGNFFVGFLLGLPAGALTLYLLLLSAYSR